MRHDAFVVQDVIGGDLVLAEVHVDGAKFGHHYWNRLPDAARLWFDRRTLRAGNRERYEILRDRVLEAMAADGRV